jgi:hypothetical protein
MPFSPKFITRSRVVEPIGPFAGQKPLAYPEHLVSVVQRVEVAQFERLVEEVGGGDHDPKRFAARAYDVLVANSTCSDGRYSAQRPK